MIKDAPSGRNPETAMRDLLRRLERANTASKPARPTQPPTTVLAARSAAPSELLVGDWVLSQHPDTGDLIATNALTGTSATVAYKGGT